MVDAVAYSTLAFTVTLAVWRPRIGWKLRITPGIAALLGVIVLLATRLIAVEDLIASTRIQWRPLLSLACIMVMTGVVQEVGAFDRLAAAIEARARGGSASRAFLPVFVISVVTPSLLNNDSAILLLTPLVLALTRRLYPGRPEVTVAFAFAVFLAPGIAPLVVSNPMNMIVAEYAGIGFSAYAATMVPVSIAGALLTYALLRLRFGRLLDATQATVASIEVPRRHEGERPALVLLGVVFLAYPITASLGGQIWMVAGAGALASLVLARVYAVAPARKIVGHVSFDILLFLWGVFLVVAGLRHAGVVDRLAALYHQAPADSPAQLALIGATSALGSALCNNHPMSILNMSAIDSGASVRPLFAALMAGDLGPRLLPIGSLAGLLWIHLLRRAGVRISIGQFVRLGALILIPTLSLSLLLLFLL